MSWLFRCGCARAHPVRRAHQVRRCTPGQTCTRRRDPQYCGHWGFHAAWPRGRCAVPRTVSAAAAPLLLADQPLAIRPFNRPPFLDPARSSLFLARLLLALVSRHPLPG
jgi:hypothetical protein